MGQVIIANKWPSRWITERSGQVFGLGDR